jgi:hypothetical protein
MHFPKFLSLVSLFGIGVTAITWATIGTSDCVPDFRAVMRSGNFSAQDGCQKRNPDEKGVTLQVEDGNLRDQSNFMVFFADEECDPGQILGQTDFGCSGKVGAANWNSFEVWDMCEDNPMCDFGVGLALSDLLSIEQPELETPTATGEAETETPTATDDSEPAETETPTATGEAETETPTATDDSEPSETETPTATGEAETETPTATDDSEPSELETPTATGEAETETPTATDDSEPAETETPTATGEAETETPTVTDDIESSETETPTETGEAETETPTAT